MSSVPLKLKDSADFQNFSSTEENYLAYQVGLSFAEADSSTPSALSLLGTDSSSYSVGFLSDTAYDSAVGTGGDGSFLTFTTTTTNLRQTFGTVSISDSDYRLPILQRDSDGQRVIREMNDSDTNTLLDRLNTRIFTSDYVGTYRLSSSAPSGDYTLKLNDVMTDTRTDGTSVQYNIYQRTNQTSPTQVLPFSIKRSNGDSGDYQGLQLMTPRQIKYSLGLKAKNRIASSDTGIGGYKLFSSAAGTPTDLGFTGTWAAKGTATDTRQAIVDVNYTRGRVSTYSRLRQSNYSADYTRTRSSAFSANYTRTRASTYSADYTKTRTSNYSLGFVGNFIGNYTRTIQTDFTRTRSSVFDYVGNYTGNFVGNYARTVTGTFTRDRVTSFSRVTRTGKGGDFLTFYAGNFVGNYTGDFVGNYTRTSTQDFLGNYTRTLNYLGNYTGDFLGEYTRDSQRTRPDDFARNFIGNYAGEFTRTRASTYTRLRTSTYLGNYVGNFTGDYLGNFAGNFTGDYVGASIDSFTMTNGVVIRDDGRDPPGEYYNIGYNNDGFQASYGSLSNNQVSFLGNATITYLSEDGDDFRASDPKDLFLRISGTHPINALASMSITNTASGITYTFPVPSSSGGSVTVLANGAPSFNVVVRISYFSGRSEWEWSYPSFPSGKPDIVGYDFDDAGRVSPITLTAGAGANTPTTNFTRTSTRTSTRNSLRVRATDFTRTSTQDFTGNYSRNFVGNYSRNFTRTRSSNFLGGTAFSRDFLGNYIGNYSRNFSLSFEGNYSRNFAGNYQGNYSRDFIGDYSRTFTGNYAGNTIDAGNTNIETYTLYVRIA